MRGLQKNSRDVSSSFFLAVFFGNNHGRCLFFADVHFICDICVFPKILRGFSPKMDGENDGSKPYEQMDDLGG